MSATSLQPTVSDATEASPRYPQRWLAAIIMIVAALMDLIDGTIVNVALPTVRRDLHASGADLEWVVSGYMLAFAATLIISGRLGDLWGRKRLFLAGVALFGAASLACGLAQDPTHLIAARIVQGFAAATLAPQVLATFRTIFEGKERGAVFGLYGAVGGAASAVGVLLGGVLVDANLFGWGWRSIFMVNVPVALLLLLLAVVFVPATRERAAGRPDLLGSLVLAAGMVAIVYPLLEGQRLGWPVSGWICLVAGVLAVLGLGAIEARHEHRQRTNHVAPLLPVNLFRVPAFSAGLLLQLVFALGLQGFFIVFAVWLQVGQGFTAFQAGLTTLAFSVGAFVSAGPAIALAAKWGRSVLVVGGVLMAAGTAAVDVAARTAGQQINGWALVPGLLVMGLGLGVLVVPLVNVVLAAVPSEAAGNASGIFSTSQQLGGALGVAILGAVFFGRLAAGGFTGALLDALPLAGVAFLACSALSLMLPRTAVMDADA